MCHLLHACVYVLKWIIVNKSMGSKLAWLFTGCVTLNKLVNNNDQLSHLYNEAVVAFTSYLRRENRIIQYSALYLVSILCISSC